MSAPAGEAVAVERSFRWVLAHEPVSVFEEAARGFASDVERETSGALRARVLTSSEYGGGAPVPPPLIAWSLAAGKLEMTQTYSPLLAQFDPRLWSVDLPFLFDDHEHATRVLDGPVGRGLLDGLLPYGIRGLAFTYSGGPRIIATSGAEIRRWEDLRGLRVRTGYSPVTVATLESLGAAPVAAGSVDIDDLAGTERIDAAETTYPRFWALGRSERLRTICETWHSLFLTVMAVNEGFFQSLPPSQREAVLAAARRAALEERRKSLAEGERARREALAEGLRVIPMEEAERRRFADATRAIHERFAPLFGRELLRAVDRARRAG